MTRIDFYLDAQDKLSVACRLVSKAYASDNRVTVYTRDEVEARSLDRMLWTTPAIAFVPHVMAHDPLAAETPVLIARDGEQLAHDDVLINLDPEWPPFFARFKRVLEIVTTDEDDKARARARFRFYKDRGYPLDIHPLGTHG
jgi:DNA polymerase-3 subunit chi